MKYFSFVSLCIVALAVCAAPSGAWASGKVAEMIADPVFQLEAFLGLVAILYVLATIRVLIDKYRATKEKEDTGGHDNAAPQNFALEVMVPNWILILIPVVLMPVLFIFAFPHIPAGDKILNTYSGLAFLIFALIMLGLSAWMVAAAFMMPASLAVTPEALVVSRWRPCSSFILYFNEIEQMRFNWEPVLDGGSTTLEFDLALAALSPNKYLKRINRISFTMRDGKKYSFYMSVFYPASIEKLVQVLKSNVKVAPVSTYMQID